ncbi:Ig-like domain-containing protein [Mycobacterium sp. shizuoka-1]|uniref:Ig-like domain-containing protein n=1 Tax=Mycobacterium sp. shizuoka-1 TaxID=2039281 RepID=UPI000C065EA1|nr:Ig-like domain-containing protein [Mycobacterium sp. shizuoka-1]GAY13466.1 hypothetical protein MSZK_01920 [Mycobacterium sp. shizuoka-1]
MSMVGWQARACAFAFMAGMSWVGLQTAGVAGADTGDAGSASSGVARHAPAAARASTKRPPATVARRLDRDRPAASANPIQDALDHVSLLVRRTFFNKAPTVHPVQLTGQHDGVITGTVGAVDPEGDRITYALGAPPVDGKVVIGSDGTFTYTPGPLFTGADAFTVKATDTGPHINLLNLFRAPSTTATVGVLQDFTPCTVCIHVTFSYGAGAELLSDETRSALQAAAHMLAFYISVAAPVNLTYTVIADATGGDKPLATAQSDFYDPTEGFNEFVVQHKVLTGVDGNGDAADGQIWWNAAAELSYYDPVPVALHELVHTLGFASSAIDQDPYWTTYDSFIVTSDGVHPISSDGQWNSDYTPNLTGGNGGLYLGGTHAVAAYGGLVPIYTPATVSSGASLSHLDGFGPGLTNLVMSVPATEHPRSLSAVELGILEDLGYTVKWGM